MYNLDSVLMVRTLSMSRTHRLGFTLLPTLHPKDYPRFVYRP